ncbi:MAG: hypothetical protein COV29_03440 [Candidatus Yanofskybacteria bacterium CG10_big_fil_rev_8_21_14_0_10_36_16]|uniref:Uncharacterized protein n=1 Tax=Candidatus Yanofskybacteria bacterium CG10_big_fil_rev_8_21_14_0_10_36_16 TaxID=1975096 RepID=A0A2J0Q724_9BACT|nr:MAG: hypothetical protein COV29_03440 [Candidatus Yanofskybacteria bacterium CG10_big_fil_rev_8_21_14_0_10_36_16]
MTILEMALVAWLFLAICAFFMLVVSFAFDGRMYPVCPECGHNLRAKRSRLLGKDAECTTHGHFKA